MQAMNPTKVLMTTDTTGGIWTYALELIKALEPYNVEIGLATMGAPLSPEQQTELENLPYVVVFESSFKLEWMLEPWVDVEKAARWLLGIAARFQPDLVHLNNLVHGNLDWGVPVVTVVHTCVLSRWKAVKNRNAPYSWEYYRYRVQNSLAASDLVVAPTEAMRHEINKLYSPFRKDAVINHGRNSKLFKFNHKEPFVFTMGAARDEAKNIKTLAEAAKNLSWPVYIAGDATDPVTGQTLEFENVHFLGHLSESEITDWLSRASVYALPSKYEPFGLSALEAAFSGCALVLGDLPSQREIWGDTACYVPSTDVPTLAGKLQKLIDDEFTRNIMGFRAMKQSIGYSATQMAHEYNRQYQQLLNKDQLTSASALEPTESLEKANLEVA